MICGDVQIWVIKQLNLTKSNKVIFLTGREISEYPWQLQFKATMPQQNK